MPPDPRLGERLLRLTRGTRWSPVAAIEIGFRTHHPQGLVKIGDAFFVSSVELQGRGHLFKVGPGGELLDALTLGEGSIYHPGGIDFDGQSLWVPVAEYRPDSMSVVYRVDPRTMQATEVFRWPDHVGALVRDTESNTLHGVSWGSRRFYAWPLGADGTVADADAGAGAAAQCVSNPAHYIDHQDCQYLGRGRMLCSGVGAYRASPSGEPFLLGGWEVIDLADHRVVWQVPIELWSPSGRPMTTNPCCVEATSGGLRAYFLPDDDASTLFVFDAAVP